MFTGHFWPLFTQCCQEPGIQVFYWNFELPFNLRLILRNTKTKLLAAQQASSRQVVHPSIPGMANGLWTSALRLSQSRSDLYRLRAFRFHAHTRTLFNLEPQQPPQHGTFLQPQFRTRRWNIAGKSFQKQVNNSLSGKSSVLIMLKSLSFTIATRFSSTARICRPHFSSAQYVPHFI